MAEPLGSILIAAHNEAATLPGCLEGFRPSLAEGRFELIIASNGSTDGTAELARDLLADCPRASVIDLETASKSMALRAGDEKLTAFPRAYLDADIVMDEDTLESLFAELSASERPAVAAPTLHLDSSASSAVVQAFYRVWVRMPYIAEGVVGVGVYAVNEPGWQRLGEFPGLLNDDEWVARHFAADERLITPGRFVARTARTSAALVRQRARVEQGNRELREGAAMVQQQTGLRDVLDGVRRRSFSPWDALCFVGIVASTKLLAAWRRRTGTAKAWSTDHTSRTGIAS